MPWAFAETLARALLAAMVLTTPPDAHAWGDGGHRIIGLIAQNYLDPAIRDRVFALLAADPDPLTAHDLASATTWADRFRDSDRNSSRVHYSQTHDWHFIDIELDAPDIDAACFGHPPMAPETPASNGPAHACVVDKIEQFAAELQAADTPPEERLLALKFLLHFVGDLHQPLHASDNHDEGGNLVMVSAPGFRSGNLHHFWDAEFVWQLGGEPRSIARRLLAQITPEQVGLWSQGSPSDWAAESFEVARSVAYGGLPTRPRNGSYRLSNAYVRAATGAVSEQLSKAGVRLAALLDRVLAGSVDASFAAEHGARAGRSLDGKSGR